MKCAKRTNRDVPRAEAASDNDRDLGPTFVSPDPRLTQSHLPQNPHLSIMASDSLPTPPSVTPTPATAAAAAAASGSQAADAPSPAAVPPATAAAAAGAQPAPAPTQAELLENLLQQIVASDNPTALLSTLRNAVGTPETREELLVGTTSAGADPLEALNVTQHTLGALFILYVRRSFLSPPPLNCHRLSIILLSGAFAPRLPGEGGAFSWILNGDSSWSLSLLKRTGSFFPADPRVSRRRQPPCPPSRSHISITSASILIQNRRASRLTVVRFGNSSVAVCFAF